MTWESIGRWFTAAFGISVFLFFMLVILPSVFEDRISNGTNALQWVFWLQTASGNWPGSKPSVISNWWFAFSAAAAFLINNSLVVVLVTVIWRWSVERATVMKLSQAFVARDAMTKQVLFEKLSDKQETIDLINEAFQEGEKRWIDELVILFGPAETARLRERLPREV